MIQREQTRCSWCGTDPQYVAYHDEEWGIPVTDDRLLFEMLILEGAQAGLSWSTILRKREGYRSVFHGFDIERVSRMSDEEQLAARSNPAIVRNRLKIASTVSNARAFLDVQHSHGSFCRYLWQFVDGRPIQNTWKSLTDIPAVTPLAESISKDLKKRGFRFVGPTIVYAYLQAVGVVNDHQIDCFRYDALRTTSFEAPC